MTMEGFRAKMQDIQKRHPTVHEKFATSPQKKLLFRPSAGGTVMVRKPFMIHTRTVNSKSNRASRVSSNDEYSMSDSRSSFTIQSSVFQKPIGEMMSVMDRIGDEATDVVISKLPAEFGSAQFASAHFMEELRRKYNCEEDAE
ncbi:hypothetical protein HDU97_004258 [Phlyctochytrium planicorne]|nr:hypothetical protein HDU97_004258 [Phlyctochytrium planicorne]